MYDSVIAAYRTDYSLARLRKTDTAGYMLCLCFLPRIFLAKCLQC